QVCRNYIEMQMAALDMDPLNLCLGLAEYLARSIQFRAPRLCRTQELALDLLCDQPVAVSIGQKTVGRPAPVGSRWRQLGQRMKEVHEREAPLGSRLLEHFRVLFQGAVMGGRLRERAAQIFLGNRGKYDEARP